MNVNEDQTLSRYDMKSIMAGSGDWGCYTCGNDGNCVPYTGTQYGGWTGCTPSGGTHCYLYGAACRIVY